MPNIEYPLLCGGTFFKLLLDARKQRAGIREHYAGKTDGLSDPKTLVALIQIFSPSYIAPTPSTLSTFKGNTSDFKNCKISSGAYLPFGDTAAVRSFDECVRTDYKTALFRMLTFTDTYLDMEKGAKKDEYLVMALIELISMDNTIKSDELFYVLENGQAITKEAVILSSDICLQSLLVGIWHYILLYRRDNKIGRNTIVKWNPSMEIVQGLNVYSCINPSECSKSTNTSDSVYEEPIIDDFAKEQADSQQHSTTQTVNNPIVFNQYGSNSIQIGNVGTLNIKHND